MFWSFKNPEADSTRFDSTFMLTGDPAQRLLESNFVLLKLFWLMRHQRNLIRAGALGFVVVTAALVYQDLSHWGGLLAVLPLVGVQALREWVVSRHIPEPADNQAVHAWFNRAVLLAGVSSVTLAGFLVLFPWLSDTSRGLLTLMLLGLITASVSTSAGHPLLFKAFALPIVLPLAGLWALWPGDGYSRLTGAGVGVLVLLAFAVMLRSFTQMVWQLFEESCRIRFREREMNDRMRTALEEAREASQAKTRFLASASHDLRQPLHVISLVTAALRMRQLDQQAADMVTLLDRVSTSLNGQLNSLLDISKLDAGLIQPQYQRIDAAEFLSQCFESLAPLARDKGLEPLLRLETDAAILTDPALLQRMVTNLCQNALKYTTQGRIVLSARNAADRVVLSVSDTGCGIDPQHHATVFQEFVQVDNPERDASQGLGLGLSIVQRLARLLGIGLRLSSRPGGGTEVELAITRVAGGPEATGALADPVTHQPDWIHLGLTVLVVDDDPTVRQACSMLLQGMGCVALLAEDLAEARKLTARQRPDVMLVDLRLRGGRNGIDAIHALRATLGPVPALLISGDTAPDRLTLAANAGLRMCHKPLTMEQLLAELARVQNERDQPPDAVGPGVALAIDPASGGYPSAHGDSQLTIPFDLPPEPPTPPAPARRR